MWHPVKMEKRSVLKRWMVRYGWLLLILLTALFLRTYQLSTAPPGLTHDEADHGITALAILEGAREVYFTIGYGREPLFDYATAVLMSMIGVTYMAGRITAVLFSLLMIAGMYAWVKLAFDRNTALLTAAGLAVGFWPVMTARQSLRSITLPAIFVCAILLFWLGIKRLGRYRSAKLMSVGRKSPRSLFAVAGVLLGLTFYTYIPARALWLVFPLLMVYLLVVRRDLFYKSWRGVLLMLGIAGAIALPLGLYLRANPAAEVRITELRGPLTAVFNGDFTPLGQNIIAGLKIISFVGDSAWRYNIAGRPFLLPIMSIFFWAGVLVAIWQALKPMLKRQTDENLRGAASFLALCWLGIGLAPVLITGPFLSTTQAIGMQPLLYLFPAIVIALLGRRMREIGGWGLEIGDWRLGVGDLFWGSVVLLFLGTAWVTYQDYFVRWAQEPEVRVQYEATMAEGMRYLQEMGVGDTAVSTITPNQYHSPALAAMFLDESAKLRWFDGRGSLLLPAAENSTFFFPGFAPLSPFLADYFAEAEWVQSLPLRATDLDRPLAIYALNGIDLGDKLLEQFTAVDGEVRVGDTAVLRGYDLQTTAVSAGETVQLVTLWQVGEAEGVRLFTHLLGADGVPIAQADRLDAPSAVWVRGDWLLQLHQFEIPMETAVGNYPLTVGMYICLDELCQETQRFPITVDGQAAGDTFQLTDLIIE